MNKFSNNIRIPHHFESSYIISICVLYTVSVPLFDGLARVLNIIILIAGLNSYFNTERSIFERIHNDIRNYDARYTFAD